MPVSKSLLLILFLLMAPLSSADYPLRRVKRRGYRRGYRAYGYGGYGAGFGVVRTVGSGINPMTLMLGAKALLMKVPDFTRLQL